MIKVGILILGETTVSNEVLDTVLKAGEVLKIRGLWRQTDEAGGDSVPAEKTTTPPTTTNVNKQVQVVTQKKPEDSQPKIAVKKDDKLLKTFNPVQQQGGVTRYIAMHNILCMLRGLDTCRGGPVDAT